jgi:hypothetical protein
MLKDSKLASITLPSPSLVIFILLYREEYWFKKKMYLPGCGFRNADFKETVSNKRLKGFQWNWMIFFLTPLLLLLKDVGKKNLIILPRRLRVLKFKLKGTVSRGEWTFGNDSRQILILFFPPDSLTLTLNWRLLKNYPLFLICMFKGTVFRGV